MGKRYWAASASAAALIAVMTPGAAIAQAQPQAQVQTLPQQASPATIAAQAEAARSLPPEDGRDADFAARGFIASRADPIIRAADGRPVWNLDAYGFVEGAAPATVHPSLWREMILLKRHGLFKVTDDVWQVRGFDLSNMTVVAGKTGWILVDPLTNRETAAAALELVNQQLGARPVSAVIYTHSHGDHFGGVGGVITPDDAKSGKVAVVAPEMFTEETASENVMAGAAMSRRGNYQFGTALRPGPTGLLGSGIGMSIPAGEITLIEPNDLIAKTGETRVVDGVAMEFQIVSGSEAPAELNVYFPQRKTLLSAEISTCSLHNILTPRGAKVRDTHAWAGFLDEALQLYGARSDVVISSHCWPRFGQQEVRSMLASQRDNYRYLHDQSVRQMNRGGTMAEVAEGLKQPPALANQWFNRGYYGTYSHNSKAVYQFYLGWYDAVPANLHAHPPTERAKRMIAAIGGAGPALSQAKAAMAEGDYRWSSDLLQNLVFAEPDNALAKALLADSYEQQGYQAESAIWRNQFLSAARDLRDGFTPAPSSVQSADLIAAVPTALLLDSAATRFNPGKLAAGSQPINLVISDRAETVGIEANDTVMIARVGQPAANPAVTVTGPRQLFLAMLFLKQPVAAMQAAGLKVEGDAAAMQALIDALDPMQQGFPIVTP